MQIKGLLRRLRLVRLLPSRSLQTLPSVEAYARWAATYPPHAHNAFMQAEEAAMMDLMPPLVGQIVLDLASGTGRYGLMAWQQQAKMVLALDNSPAMMTLNPLPRRILASLDRIPLLDACADVVICGLALGHARDLGPAVAELGRVLRGGGYAVVSDFHPFLFLNGARRTFSTETGIYAVEHHVHLVSDYHAACSAADLEIDAVREPILPEAAGLPVALVFRLHKRIR